MKVPITKSFFLERLGTTKNKIFPLSIGSHSVGRSRASDLPILSKFCNRKICHLIVDRETVIVSINVSSRWGDFGGHLTSLVFMWMVVLLNCDFMQGEKQFGGVYVNKTRFRQGKILMNENDKIGFGVPTDLSEDEMNLHGSQVQIYKLKCEIAPKVLCTSEKWIPTSVLRSFKAPLKTKTSPQPPSLPSRESSYSSTMKKAGPAVEPRKQGTKSVKRVQFAAEITNYRLFDKEDPSFIFLWPDNQ